MTDAEPKSGKTHPLQGTSTGEGSASGELSVVKSAFSVSKNAAGEFDISQARHALKERDQSIKEADAQVERETRSKRAAQQLQHRNVLFWLAVGTVVFVLILALIVSFAAKNDDTLAFARGLVTLLVGGILGGVAGYLTNQQSR